MQALDPTFVHATSLVSLTLVQLDGFTVFDSFGAYPNAFPHLRHLKLMLLDRMPFPSGYYDALCTFLEGRPGLERLDVDTPGADPQQLLAVLAGVDNLKVLGLDLRTATSEEHVERLADMLPMTLTALHTQHAWEGLSLDAYEMQPIVSRRRALDVPQLTSAGQLDVMFEMPLLRFLHLHKPLVEDLIVAEQIAKLCVGPLEVLGLGETFYRIDHTTNAVMSRMDQHWLLLQRTSEAEDSESGWLLKWHVD